MKKIFFNLTLILATAAIYYPAFADHVVEARIEKIFIQQSGYDSNDNVQMMLDGTLANQCQQVSDTDIRYDESEKVFNIRQIAKVRPTTECHWPNLPKHLALPGHFSKEISLGVLKPGDYKVAFRVNGVTSTRLFTVAAAKNEETDDEIYAPVSNFFVPEMMEETQEAQIVMTGVIGSRCLSWKGIDIEQQGDIFVIKPKMRIVSTNFCSVTPWPLEKVISLGKLKPGRYMIHVRSMNGMGLSRVFSVTETTMDPSSRVPVQ